MTHEIDKPVKLLHRPTGTEYDAALRVGELDHKLRSGHPWIYVAFLHEGTTYVGTALDYFGALNNARVRMEPDLFPMLAGACINLGMSGMARDMGRGWKGYVLETGVKPNSGEMVEIFSEELIGDLGTVAEWEVFYKAWLELPRT